jgi:molecular chaperone HtpG
MIEPSRKPIPFKAETRQLLNILIHSLYTEREIFLRELISNASDALTRLNFEMLTNRNIRDANIPLEIRIYPDPEKHNLTITDTGLGMTYDEVDENLGTIAHSGARAFMQAAENKEVQLSDIIGQFGVGFYSAFMVADSIHVISCSYKPDAEAVDWFSTADDTYTIEHAEKTGRGTSIIIQLKEDAYEFAEESRLREIVRKHSDFIPFPIYINAQEEQVNRQTAIWRQTPRQTDESEIYNYYQQMTLDPQQPLGYAHMNVDAPVQMFALLYIPTSIERSVFSPRREPGLKLYSRKVLIQEYCKELLPDYFDFVQGVVDSEDLPLNISRETIQANRVMAQLKKLVSNKVVDTLKNLAKEKPDSYLEFWKNHGRSIKQGIATEPNEPENLYPLLRFHSTTHLDEWVSFDEYLDRLKPNQDKIYYILGDDNRSIRYSPHLDPYRPQDIEVLFLTDPLDSFVLLRLTKYHTHDLANVAVEPAPKTADQSQEKTELSLSDGESLLLIEVFKTTLGERVTDVRTSDRLIDSPARLVDPEGTPDQSMQRVYQLLNKEFETPKKVLEINPKHLILQRLSNLPAEDPRREIVINQVYDNALLIEGLHPDPASMISRIQDIIAAALK